MNQLAEINVQEQQQRQSSYRINLPPQDLLPTGALGSGFLVSTSMFLSTSHVVPAGLSIVRHGAGNFDVRRYQPLQFSAARQQSHGRITGPVRVLKKIVSDWKLSPQEVASLLAYSDPQLADNVLNGIAALRDQDREDRVRLIYAIYRVLSSLFTDLQNQRRWLRAPSSFLNGRAPLDVMISDRIPGMMLVRDMVDRLAGR